MHENCGTGHRLWVACLLSGGLCATAILIVLLVYGVPYNVVWLGLAGAGLVAAFTGPIVLLPLIRLIKPAKSADGTKGDLARDRRQVLFGLGLVSLSGTTAGLAVHQLASRELLPLLRRDALQADPWPVLEDLPASDDGWGERSIHLRARMRKILTFPADSIELDPVIHHQTEGDGHSVQAVTYASETGSRVTASLYLPKSSLPVPAIIIAVGHGASKSTLYAQYAGQLYAKMGFVCLIPDTIGEEERHFRGNLDTRSHELVHMGAKHPTFVRQQLGRMMMGKIVWDLVRGVDYLETRDEVVTNSIGVAGFSAGGFATYCLTGLDARIKAAVVNGFAFVEWMKSAGGWCVRQAWTEMSRKATGAQTTALAGEHAAILQLTGDSESRLDPNEGGLGLVRTAKSDIKGARELLAGAGFRHDLEAQFEKGAGHRPLFLTSRSLAWFQKHLMRSEARLPIPDREIIFANWAKSQGREVPRPALVEEYRNKVIDIGVVARDPIQLACFPERRSSPAEYTLRGWIEAQRRVEG